MTTKTNKGEQQKILEQRVVSTLKKQILSQAKIYEKFGNAGYCFYKNNVSLFITAKKNRTIIVTHKTNQSSIKDKSTIFQTKKRDGQLLSDFNKKGAPAKKVIVRATKIKSNKKNSIKRNSKIKNTHLKKQLRNKKK